MRKWIKSVIAIGAISTLLNIGCGVATQDPTGVGSEKEPTPVGFSSSNADIPVAKTISLDTDLTKQDLDAMPLEERLRAQMRLEELRRAAVRQDATIQAQYWLDRTVPECEHQRGNKACYPVFIELEPSEICGWKWSRQVTQDDLRHDGHYFLALADGEGKPSGYEWIASHNHQAYRNGAVLDIIYHCWWPNPTEMTLP